VPTVCNGLVLVVCEGLVPTVYSSLVPMVCNGLVPAMDDGLVLTVTCSMGLVMQASLELAARGGSMPKGCSAQAGSVRSVQGTVDDSELAEMIMSRCDWL